MDSLADRHALAPGILREIWKRLAEIRADGRMVARIDLEPWEAEALDWPATLYGINVRTIPRYADD